MTEKKTDNKNTMIGIIVLDILIVVCVFAYVKFKPRTVEGAKTIMIQVIDDQNESTEYEVHTDAEYLLQAMEDVDGLTFDGEEGDYGFTVYTVNDVTADFNTDGAYWSFYLNDEYCNYGVSEQPVNDGDEFMIRYEVFE